MSDRICNRTACRATFSREWYWNHVTRAWYCWSCAERINRSPMNTLPGDLCINEYILPPFDEWDDLAIECGFSASVADDRASFVKLVQQTIAQASLAPPGPHG